MKLFDDAFHDALRTSVPSNDVLLSEVQLGFSGRSPADVAAVLQFQEAVLKQKKKTSWRRQSPKI